MHTCNFAAFLLHSIELRHENELQFLGAEKERQTGGEDKNTTKHDADFSQVVNELKYLRGRQNRCKSPVQKTLEQ